MNKRLKPLTIKNLNPVNLKNKKDKKEEANILHEESKIKKLNKLKLSRSSTNILSFEKKPAYTNVGSNTERKRNINYRDIMIGKKLKDFKVFVNLKKTFIRIPNNLSKSFLQRDNEEIENLFKLNKPIKSFSKKIYSLKNNNDLNTENIVLGLSKLSPSDQSLSLLRKNVKMILSSSYSNILKKNYRDNKMNREMKINNLILNQENLISLKTLDLQLENYPNPKFSNDLIINNIIKAFAANSYKSKLPLENYGKILIILDVLKPKKIDSWPLNISIFSLYDGFYGNLCSDYLMNNLHKNILKAPFFHKNYQSAFSYGYNKTEKNYEKFIFEQNKMLNNNIIDNSGSSIINFFLIEDIIYIINLGDCKVLLSENNCTHFSEIINPHNEKNEFENKRIINNGGYFQSGKINYNKLPNNIIFPSHELVMPCMLRSTRCFGAFLSKNIQKNLILSNPDIISFKVNQNFDFIFIGNQEIFRNLSNRDVIDCIKLIFFEKDNKSNIHVKCKNAIDLIIKTAEIRKSFGNLSCILIMFKEL